MNGLSKLVWWIPETFKWLSKSLPSKDAHKTNVLFDAFAAIIYIMILVFMMTQDIPQEHLIEIYYGLGIGGATVITMSFICYLTILIKD